MLLLDAVWKELNPNIFLRPEFWNAVLIVVGFAVALVVLGYLSANDIGRAVTNDPNYKPSKEVIGAYIVGSVVAGTAVARARKSRKHVNQYNSKL